MRANPTQVGDDQDEPNFQDNEPLARAGYNAIMACLNRQVARRALAQVGNSGCCSVAKALERPACVAYLSVRRPARLSRATEPTAQAATST